MSGFTELNHKAIAWWCEKQNLAPQLSAWPYAYFKHRENGKESKINIFDLTTMFESDRKETRKEAARVRRQTKGGK